MSVHRPAMLPLVGGCNLRDLGGYATVDGRGVIGGRLYRSGVLSYLTPDDHACLAPLGLRTIVDLRRPDEIAVEPTRWPAPIRILSFPDDPQHGPAQREAPWERSATAEEAQGWMHAAYKTMHEWLAPALRATVQALLAEETPLLFHCAAGKDRTGFCAGIILTLLGVPEEAVLDDYAFTNEAVDLHAFSKAHRSATLGLTDTAHPLDRLPSAVRNVLEGADRAYLRTALASVEAAYGSVEGYARGALGLTGAEIAAIRDSLLGRRT